MKPVKLRPLPLLAWGGAWVCLSGLALVRLWALLYGRLPSLAIPALAALLTARMPSKWLAPLPPVLCNAAIVGGMLAWYEAGFGPNFPALYAMNAFTVGLGELVSCYGLGLVILTVLPRIPYLRGRMAPQRL